MGEAYISNWRTIPALGFSDHVAITFNIGWDNLRLVGGLHKGKQSSVTPKLIGNDSTLNSQVLTVIMSIPPEDVALKESTLGTNTDLSQDRGRTLSSWRTEEFQQLSKPP